MFGVSGLIDLEFTRMLRWARGLDVNDEDEDGSTNDGRPIVGAPLHTRPHLVTYHIDTASNTQDDILFVLTNDGYVHMVPTADPTGSATPAGGARLEKWTFMPPDKLSNLKTLYDDVEASNITYGVDGGMDVWVNDVNGDFDLLDDVGNVDSGEHAYLYFGQRRGGSSYYALDVSNPTTPRYLWSIDGDGAAANSPLARLGQSWSRPRHTRLFFKEGGATQLSIKDVIVVGGGYDTAQDTTTSRTGDSIGNAIYILDATTGAILWWAGDTPVAGAATPNLVLSDMDYSIPGDIRLIDINGDGVTDRFFASDMGGQIWRFDIANNTVDTLANRITGGRIADLQKSAAADNAPGNADNRRFFYPPDVALIVPDTGPAFHSIAVGSGYRAHPNDTVINDRIYVLKDYDINEPPKDNNDVITYTTRYEGELLDVTSTLDIAGLSDNDKAKLSKGWYLRLTANGEKSLATALTVDGRVLITTFIPADQTQANLTDVCAPSQGSARLYALDAENGLPVANLDGQGGNSPQDFTLNDRFYDLKRRGIAPEVTIIFPEHGNLSPIPIVGTELVPELKVDNSPQATYWFQENVH